MNLPLNYIGSQNLITRFLNKLDESLTQLNSDLNNQISRSDFEISGLNGLSLYGSNVYSYIKGLNKYHRDPSDIDLVYSCDPNKSVDDNIARGCVLKLIRDTANSLECEIDIYRQPSTMHRIVKERSFGIKILQFNVTDSIGNNIRLDLKISCKTDLKSVDKNGVEVGNDDIGLFALNPNSFFLNRLA
jgi:hypothetical protein